MLLWVSASINGYNSLSTVTSCRYLCWQAHHFQSALPQCNTGPAAEQSTWGAHVYQGGAKFEIKHKSRCLQKSKLVDWGGKHVGWGARPPLGAGSGVI